MYKFKTIFFRILYNVNYLKSVLHAGHYPIIQSSNNITKRQATGKLVVLLESS